MSVYIHLSCLSHMYLYLCVKNCICWGRGVPHNFTRNRLSCETKSSFIRCSYIPVNNDIGLTYRPYRHQSLYKYRVTYRSISVSVYIHTGPYRYQVTYRSISISVYIHTGSYRYQVTYRPISVLVTPPI